MRRYADLPIRIKIAVVIAAFTSISLVVGFGIVVFLEYRSAENDLDAQMKRAASVIGVKCAPFLAAADRASAASTLSLLAANPVVRCAWLYDREGSLFAADGAASCGALTGPAESQAHCSPVTLRGQRQGTVCIAADRSSLTRRSREYLLTLLLIAVGVVGLGYLLALRFQRVISDPIMNLAGAARRISEGLDYSIRVEKSGRDEIGVLCDAFNAMLTQMEKRKHERDRAEIALKRNEIRFRNMIVQSNDPVFVQREGRIIFINPRFEEYFGYNLKEIQANDYNLLNFVTESSREYMVEQVLKSYHGQNVEKAHDIQCVSREGRVYDVEINLSIISWDEETAILATMRDISIRKRALEDLSRKQNEVNNLRLYLQNIIDSMPSILIGVDSEGRITEWNVGAQQFTGVMKTAAAGRPVGEVFPFFEDLHNRVIEAIRARQADKAERVPSRVNGEVRYSDIMVYPLIADGVDGAVIRIDDVSSRVRIENMMVQTEKMMSVGGLAAGMAHEINNPLGGILMSAQNLLRRVSPDLEQNRVAAAEVGITIEQLGQYMEKRGLVRMLSGIMEMGDRASKIVTNMLSFSRRSESRKTAVDPRELVKVTVELAASDYDLKKKYDFRHIEIVREFDDDLPMIYCVATEIEQVLLNLLKNASQAMNIMDPKPERPRIILRLRHRGDRVQFEVEDNGPGISRDTLKRVFEPFFTTKKVGEGTGLGLSVSYFIVTDNHKGEMLVESEEGRGTRFIVRLPVGGE